MTDNTHDIQLWRRTAAGEIGAFRELFDRYYGPLCRFAEFWLRDRSAAEEIVLDVYTHIWQNAGGGNLTTPVSVRSYLLRAVRNRALNHLRDKRFSYISFEEFEPLLADENFQQIELEDLLRLVDEAVAELPERCREVFVKSRTEELSNAEIAQALQISEKTVEAQITKALRRIRIRTDKIS